MSDHEQTVRVVTDMNESLYVTRRPDDDWVVLVIDEDHRVAEILLTPRDVERLRAVFHGDYF